MPRTYKGTCTECGAENQDLFPVNDVDHLCPICLDDQYFFCDVCQDYYHVDHWESFALKDGRVCCEDCREDFDDDEIEEIEEFDLF